MDKVMKPKAFNRTITVRMNANVEVLPLNASFVARAMFVMNNVEKALRTFESTPDGMWHIDEMDVKTAHFALNSAQLFFKELYDCMTTEVEELAEVRTKNGPSSF